MAQSNTGGSNEGAGYQLREIPSQTPPDGGTSDDPALGQGGLDDLGDLPRSYGSDTIFLIAQEPRWLFTYWDIDISRHPGGISQLRVYFNEDALETEIEVPFESRNWYIPVKNPGGRYVVEIGYNRGRNWRPIARSIPVQTPPDSLSESDQFDFATLPLHISFQKLTESIEAAVRSGEPLTAALSRLQRDGGFAGLSEIAFPVILAGQRLMLESLLGREFLDELSSGSFSSGQIEEKIRTFLQEKLSSGAGASELFSGAVFGPAASSLFSGMSGFPGESLASWSAESLASWASAALTSWMTAAGAITSWSGESSWGSGAESSWTTGALSIWLQAMQSSWVGGVQSSWAGAALSSWNQAAITSWSQAAVTSWAGGSESVSSFGESREFFMHVNAEVIFYGGTDPRAKVTVDGKPITLNPDGTFRYHFIFPNGAYEIPIVATSPDGVETRSAMLRFERDTAKTGKVDDTAQPPLGSPMGAAS